MTHLIAPSDFPPLVKKRLHTASRAWLEMMDTVPETRAWEETRSNMHRAYDAYHIALTLAGYKLGAQHAGDTVIVRKCFDLLLLARLTERAIQIHGFSIAEIDELYAHQQEFESGPQNDDAKPDNQHTAHRQSAPSIEWTPFQFGKYRDPL